MKKEFLRPQFDMVLLSGEIVVCSIEDGGGAIEAGEWDDFDEPVVTFIPPVKQ